MADARKVMERAKGSLIPVVLFVDEVHRWSKAQQDVLLPGVEDGTVTFIGATTENPYFSLITPLLSRCLLLRLEPLSSDDLRELMERALADPDRGSAKQGVKVDDEALDAPGGDRRRRRAHRADGPGGGGPGGAGARRGRRSRVDRRRGSACRRRPSSTTARATRTST